MRLLLIRLPSYLWVNMNFLKSSERHNNRFLDLNGEGIVQSLPEFYCNKMILYGVSNHVNKLIVQV